MLQFPNKQLRAKVIKDYVEKAGYEGVVCFSCGNASAALKEAGLDVVDISVRGDLQANRWWQPEEIRRIWPNRLDATSGHLPLVLMSRIGFEFRRYLGELSDDVILIPTGSGETIISLSIAYPKKVFVAAYNFGPGTEYEPDAPLNAAVASKFNIIWGQKDVSDHGA